MMKSKTTCRTVYCWYPTSGGIHVILERLQDFDTEIANLVDDGWSIVGGPTVVVTGTEVERTQLMIKHDTIEVPA